MSLGLKDMFLVGLGFDIVGAALLAKGLLISFAMIAKLNTMGGLNTGDVVDRCRNWRDAAFGVAYLLVGFSFQVAGYVAELAGAQSGTGSPRAYTGAGLCLLIIGITSGIWYLSRTPALKKVIVRVILAREGSGDSGDEARTGWTRYKASRLLDLGEEAGWPPTPAELEDGGAPTYGKRVFGVKIPARL